MYRIDIHLKEDAEPCSDLRHLSYDALWVDVKDNSVNFVTPENEVKNFNMDKVSYFRVHKFRGYGIYEQDGEYYKLFAINVNENKYYCVSSKYDATVIYGFKNYKDAMEAFKRSEDAGIYREKIRKEK